MAAKTIWEKFDEKFDTKGLKDDVKEAEENGGTRREVPHGAYEVEISKMELTTSKKGDPMFTCWMKIISGEYKNSLIFMNQVVTQGFQIHIVNEFLRSLMENCSEAPEIGFETFGQYADLIMDIAELIDGNYEYQLYYGENNKGYSTFGIEEVYTLED